MSKQVKVLCIWQPNERLKTYLQKGLEEYPQVNLIIPQENSHEVFMELVKKHKPEIIMGWRPQLELLQTAQNLKLFINPGAGVQHLIPLFKELSETRSVTLVNGHGNAYFTAQHTLAILLALMNKVVLHHNWMKEGQWRKGDAAATSIPLRGRKVGLLGYGAVNQRVHKFLSGFDIEFAILRTSWEKQKMPLPTPAVKYTFDGLNRFLKDIDIMVVAVPLTSKTEGMIGKRELELLGKEGLLVNMGRGPVINEKSLYEALKNESITGAAIDVWYNYRPEADAGGKKHPASFPFHELENVILSPHRGASPMSDLKRWDEQIENISRFAEGRKDFINIVDVDKGY